MAVDVHPTDGSPMSDLVWGNRTTRSRGTFDQGQVAVDVLIAARAPASLSYVDEAVADRFSCAVMTNL